MVISEETREITVSAADDDGTMAAFGDCIAM